MKIVGGHDYWDSAAAYGVDQSVTLVRNTNIETPNFESSDFFFPVITFLGPLQCVLLLSNYLVCCDQKLLNFLLVGVVRSKITVVVFFVLAVQVKNDLG